jgi:hypothetical protein
MLGIRGLRETPIDATSDSRRANALASATIPPRLLEGSLDEILLRLLQVAREFVHQRKDARQIRSNSMAADTCTTCK